MTRAWSLDPGRVGFISWLFSLWPKGSCESQLWVSHLENRAGAVLNIKWEEEADRGDIGCAHYVHTGKLRHSTAPGMP